MSRRFTSLLLAAVCILGSCALIVTHATGQNAEQNPASSKLVESARGALEAASALYEVGQADTETVYLWSRRLVDAEIQAGAGNDAALQHVARMRKLHDRVATLNRAGVAGGEELKLHATAFYVEEAQALALEHARP
jgi:hypothetical protein